MPKDATISMKLDEKYVQMITYKDGWKVGFSPAFKKQFLQWIKDPEENWLNMNFKEWDNKPTEEKPSKKTTSLVAELNDEIPF